MRVAVVDYGSGNLTSAARALARAASDNGIAVDVTVTADPEMVAGADRVVLPGQGAFADCAAGLDAVDGLHAAIDSAVAAGRPFLGICVGMQLMAERGLEHTVTRGFGWVAGDVAEMPAPGLRLPQMGWNALDFTPGSHPLLDGLEPGDHAYFVHSYALCGARAEDVLATTTWRPHPRHRRHGQPRRHPVPCGKEPGDGAAHPRQLPALDAVSQLHAPTLAVERANELDEDDLQALCEAADAAIIEGGGFGWVDPPGRNALESYFRGILLVPERQLFVGRLDGVIVGSAQLVRPPRNNEAQAFAATLMHSFVAPYARGHGLARLLTRRVEDAARAMGFMMLNLDVRETQTAAIKLYEGAGYLCWGVHPAYARVGGQVIRGLFYCKKLRDGR